MESSAAHQGGGGGTDEPGEGEDEESSSSLRTVLCSRRGNAECSIEGTDRKSVAGEESENDDDAGSLTDGEDTLETALAQFRRQWRDELQKANVNTHQPTSAEQRSTMVLNQLQPLSECRSDRNTLVDRASQLFQHGIDLEQQGNMHEAVRFYRHAVQLMPDIEKVFLANNGARTYAMVASETNEKSLETESDLCSDDYDEANLSNSDMLTDIFRHRLFITNGGVALCTPDENANDNTMHISRLPVEVLMYIFRWVISSDLDMRQLEQLSMTCCGFYMAARNLEFWRLACVKTWGVRVRLSDSPYLSWRQMYIHRPRLCYNGVYISKMTYVRHGEAAYQDQFYRPWHLVVYYRYLRFFADGTLYMLTTPDEPSTIVPALKMKQSRLVGLLKGTYRLIGSYNLTAVLERANRRPNSSDNSSPFLRNRVINNNEADHIYAIELTVNSIKRRRNVQLQWCNYEVTTRYKNGQEYNTKFDLSDQNYPALYFSRVKSYNATAESPLE